MVYKVRINTIYAGGIVSSIIIHYAEKRFLISL